jgi:predicted O-methyltransferase YrrM
MDWFASRFYIEKNYQRMNKQFPILAQSASSIGLLMASAIYVQTILANIVHRLVIRRVRSQRQVTSDYDQGEWRDVLEDRRWEICASLEDYVLSTETRSITALVEGRLSRIPVRDYYAYRTRKLVSTLKRFSSSAEALVEVGSGAGRNLFAIAYGSHWPRLLGLELSPTGREVTRRVVERFGLDGINTEHIDLLDPASAGFAHLWGATVFSFYCLEQLPSHTLEVLVNLLRAGVKRVIHIEPTPELLAHCSLKDLATISYIWRQDYQRTLVGIARELEHQGRIRVLALERLNFAPSCRNDPTLVVWEPLDARAGF